MSCKFMVSFDVESLYTNIPLEGCIDLAVNYISKGNPNIKLSKPDLRSLSLQLLPRLISYLMVLFMIK